ncbi:MAG: serine/threonine protein kinase [Sandaracinaceae bacterium]
MFAVRDKVGDYEIVAKLKAGGMATLFLGERRGASGFSRHVAIKVVHEHLANDPMFVRMFVDEALLSSKIHHPNVVHVEELRQVGGRHFLVMEYVHGCALSSLMLALRRRGRTLSPELATYVAIQVAEGLHAAHTAKDSAGLPLGVVHRDVSPQNVLLAYRGHVKLIDFGVAKAAGRAQQTTGGSLKGKIRYMSPEQAMGKEVDARTDVYALGVVLWECLTGHKAFQADNDFALLEMVRDPKLPAASQHNPQVPPVLDEVIATALAKDPGNRYQSAQEMRRALAKALPSALALDSSDLERLLGAVMSEAIAADLEKLPESVSGVLAKASDVHDDAVMTLTVSAAGLSAPTEPKIPVVPEAVHEIAETVATPPPTAVHADGVLSETEAPRRRRRPRSALVMAVVFGAILVGSFGATAVFLVGGPGAGDPPMTATELPTAGPTHTDPPATPDVTPEHEPPATTPEPTPVEPPTAVTVEATTIAVPEEVTPTPVPDEEPEAAPSRPDPPAGRARRSRWTRDPAVGRPTTLPGRPPPSNPIGVPLTDEF